MPPFGHHAPFQSMPLFVHSPMIDGDTCGDVLNWYTASADISYNTLDDRDTLPAGTEGNLESLK